MIRAMARRSLREWPAWILGASSLLALAAAAAVAYYPTWRANTASAEMLVRFVPPSFGWMRDKLLATAMGGMEGWLAVQHFYKGLSLLGCIYAVLFGAIPVAREFETGTAQVLFSRPAPRWAIGAWLYVAGLLAVWVPAFASTLALPPMAARVGDPVEVVPLLRGVAVAGALLSVVYSYSFLFSTLFDAQARAALCAGSLTMGMALLAVLTKARRASLFYYFDPVVFGRLLQGGPLPWPLLALCAGICGSLAALSLWILQRRDC